MVLCFVSFIRAMSERSRALERNPTAFASRTIDPSISRRDRVFFRQISSGCFRLRRASYCAGCYECHQRYGSCVWTDWCCNDFQYGGRVFAFVLMGHFVERTDDPGQEGILLRVARWIFQYIPKCIKVSSNFYSLHLFTSDIINIKTLPWTA
ncbi:uncharacterized protein LOC9633171 [Selaginella moellendorffii]|uniref:uncharacterized protein LOC9633171 n=1 Tax=Selaginella moellendorffii TaxID=88036 RepID=UPI000D1CF17A|nr:uncharacterized protein LOC9633171 [Selaginella moellendorffii]|eukprot:XP_024531304.1 uncharacterized protein LOC9633171 [Selaginella moellendorffii]